MWDDIYKPNSIGSEGGTIIADEEYKESCRITLERCERLNIQRKGGVLFMCVYIAEHCI